MGDDFDDYVRARTRVLLRLAYLLTGDGHLAEDVVQDVLARAHRRWDRIAKASSPHAYVRRMVVNEVYSCQRRRRVLLVLRPTEQIPEQTLPDASDGSAQRDAVWELVSSLPPRQRAVLVLRYYEDLADEQIAETLAISPGTVRSTASRALATLRASPDVARHLSRPEPPTEPPTEPHQLAHCTQES